MSLVHLAMLVSAVVGVLWLGWRIPLGGWRRRFIIGCRVLSITLLCLALWAGTCQVVHQVARHVVYLVDGSASIDRSQREWIVRRIASLESLRPERVERAVMVFGGDAQVVAPLGQQRLTETSAIQQMLEQTTIERDHTSLETALLSVRTVLPPHHPGRVIVLSDGRETAGNVTGLLAFLRQWGLSVYPAPPPVFGHMKTTWDSLTVPPVVQRGAPVALQLVVFNGAGRTKQGQVTVAFQGVPIKRQRVTVRPGWQVLKLSVPSIQRGTMALDVQLEIPEEQLTERRQAYTEVEGPPQLLLVSERLGTLPLLANALKHRDMEIAVSHPTDLPTDANRFMDYDAVVLFNIAKSSLLAAQVAALQTYLTDDGGGLVMIGLGGDLANEIEHPAPLDVLLPVQFEPKGFQEAKRRVCMILLIDRSTSMFGPRIAATKRAAVELVKQLSPEDLVGVLAFDTEPYVVAEVQPAGQAEKLLVEKLVKLRSSGGTDIYPALAASANRLDLTGAMLKHIILLSDGVTPFHAKAYDALISSFKDQHITVSTIGIGETFVNTDYLKWLAQSTGGTFYPMRTLDELPRLIAKDTQHALGQLPFTEGYFQPTPTTTTDWFQEQSGVPSLRGYLTTTARLGARVDLTVKREEGDDPILARWSLGQGRVVSFTSDADTRWSPAWIRWSGFEGAWANIVRWAMRPRFTEELFVSIDEGRGQPQLIVEGTLHDPHAELIAPADSQRFPLSLVQTGSWRWHASLEQIPSGWYQLGVESRLPAPPPNSSLVGPAPADGGVHSKDQEHSSVFARRWVQIGTLPATLETTGQPPQEALLRQIANATSGVYEMPDSAFLPPTTTATLIEPLWTWWLPLVILLLLMEIALRGSSQL